MFAVGNAAAFVKQNEWLLCQTVFAGYLLLLSWMDVRKRKLNLEWGPLSQSEIAPILNAVSGVFFTVTFPDPQLGIITKTMYVGDRTAPAYQYIDEEVKWSGLKLNLIEK